MNLLPRLALPLAILALVAACALLASPWMGQGFELADLSTDSQHRLTRQLEDGSLLTLDASSSVDVEFDAQQRHLQLLAGQVLLEVAPGDPRPFRVGTPEGTLRPLDARLIIEHLGNATQVSVLHGRVELQEAGRHLSLGRGQQLRFSAGEPGTLETVDTGMLQAAWHLQRLPAAGQPLVTTLERLARHRQGVLLFDREALQGLRVSYDLPQDDSDQALADLQADLPISVHRFTRWVTVVSKADRQK
ncbi:FecR domain-containing protein [Pseudomonas sp. p1(2021b)]|uniref:FecR family protein n=1 Tax=Pseudomonas sp. p1(2021b) TaxID=2874628 RepID=UPI001CCEB476|nr:FecR domain-containing protein [Pseudomonas sp. p1(2021b)]UBM23592.1 FecR domain-containing protein [Pseudomonas sp. p1(2021b)]